MTNVYPGGIVSRGMASNNNNNTIPSGSSSRQLQQLLPLTLALMSFP
jgi:hypothetical protein